MSRQALQILRSADWQLVAQARSCTEGGDEIVPIAVPEDEPLTPSPTVVHLPWAQIFDGDPARVVVVDPGGTVVAAHLAWRSAHAPGSGAVDLARLNVFELLVRSGDAIALHSAQLLSEVLDGERDGFVLEYASPEADDHRSTTLRAYPWVQDGERWVVLRKEDSTALGDARELVAALSTVVDDLSVAAIVSDLAHRVRFWNRAAEQLYGYSAEQAMGRRLEELITIGGGAEQLGAEQLDETGRAASRQRHRRRDGSMLEVDLAVRLRPRRDGLPALLAFSATAAGAAAV